MTLDGSRGRKTATQQQQQPMLNYRRFKNKFLDPVVQSVVSFTKSLVEDTLSIPVFTESIDVIFLLKNCQKLLQC